MSDVPIDPADVNASLFVSDCEACRPVREALDEFVEQLRINAEYVTLRGRSVPQTGGAVDGFILTTSLHLDCTECGGTGEVLTVLGERLLRAFLRRAPADVRKAADPF